MPSPPNLQTPLILTHVSKSPQLWHVPESLQYPLALHAHTHTLQSGLGCCPTASFHSHSNNTFNTYLLPSLYTTFLECKHFIVFTWASPEPSTVPGMERVLKKCLMKPQTNECITVLQRELGGVWKGHIYIEKVNFGASALLWKINNWNDPSNFSATNIVMPFSTQQRISKH